MDGRGQPALRPAVTLRAHAERPPSRTCTGGSSSSPRRRTPPGPRCARRPRHGASACSSVSPTARRSTGRRRGGRCTALSLAEKLAVLRRPGPARRLVDRGRRRAARLDPSMLFVLPAGRRPATTASPQDSLAAHAARRGRHAGGGLHRPRLERDGEVVCNFPFLNQELAAVEEMLDDPVVTLGPRRRRRPRGPDHGRQPADVRAHLLGARAGAVVAGGGDPPAHVRHGRPVRHHATVACCGPAPSPT